MLRRFQSAVGREILILCHFGAHAASYAWELSVPPATQLLEIDCQEVWRELDNYMEGDLTSEMRDRIERHLQGFPHCRAVYDGSRNIVRLLGNKDVFELPRGFSRRLYERLSSMH